VEKQLLFVRQDGRKTDFCLKNVSLLMMQQTVASAVRPISTATLALPDSSAAGLPYFFGT
jgi:hypothetical protein